MPQTIQFDTPDYTAFVDGFARRLHPGPLSIVLVAPSVRQRGAVLAELSDAAQMPLHVVPLEARLADRLPIMLASLREDFDAVATGPAVLCFRHADAFVSHPTLAERIPQPPPLDYIFERARRFKGAVVVSFDDASATALVGARGDVWIHFTAA